MKTIFLAFLLNATVLMGNSLPFGLSFGMKRDAAESALSAFSTISRPKSTYDKGIERLVWSIVDPANDMRSGVMLSFDGTGLIEFSSQRDGLNQKEFEIYFPKLLSGFNELKERTGGIAIIEDVKHRSHQFKSPDIVVSISAGPSEQSGMYYAMMTMTDPVYHQKWLNSVLERSRLKE